MIDVKQFRSSYPQYRVDIFPKRSFPIENFYSALDQLTRDSRDLWSVEEIGRSFEGRPLKLITLGKGTTGVLLWSQMHGDESTATMAILDLLHYFHLTRLQQENRDILQSLQLIFLPILNPDGAARFQRRTMQQIDMNRDARAFITPEAAMLKQIRDRFQPKFGFNLHDQELSTTGTTKEVTAIALLAPAFDSEKSVNDVRLRAKQVASVFAGTLRKISPGKIARYDDTFEPRAFGDMMQAWGTSTVLVESGHAIGDPEKNFIRELNVIGLLSSLHSIATGTYHKENLQEYESLPFNGKRAYDVIVRNVCIRDDDGREFRADLGISYQVDTHSENPPRLVDMGDLSTFVGLQEVDGGNSILPLRVVEIGKPFEWTGYFPQKK